MGIGGGNSVNLNGTTHYIADNFLIDLGTAQAKGPGSLTFIKIQNNGGSGNTTNTGQNNGQQTNNQNTNPNNNTGAAVIIASAVVNHTNKNPCGTDLPPVYVDPPDPASNSNVSVDDAARYQHEYRSVKISV